MSEDPEFGLDIETLTCPRCRINMRLNNYTKWTCPAGECPWGGENSFTEAEILKAKKELWNAAVEGWKR